VEDSRLTRGRLEEDLSQCYVVGVSVVVGVLCAVWHVWAFVNEGVWGIMDGVWGVGCTVRVRGIREMGGPFKCV